MGLEKDGGGGGGGGTVLPSARSRLLPIPFGAEQQAPVCQQPVLQSVQVHKLKVLWDFTIHITIMIKNTGLVYTTTQSENPRAS